MARGAALRWIARPVMVALLALVAWGNLLLAVTLWNAAAEGASPAVTLLLADGESGWAWLNVGTTVLAMLVWLVGLALALWNRLASAAAD